MFCSVCAAVLPELPPVRCPGCGAKHWRNAKPCSGALVTRDDKLLLVRRTIEPWNGLWDIPGGFCEPEEHPIAAAEREILEETGFSIRVTDFLGIWLDDYGEIDVANGSQQISLCVYYHAVPIDDGSAGHETDEVSEVRWFGADELPDRIAFPNHAVEVLEAWRVSRAGPTGNDRS